VNSDATNVCWFLSNHQIDCTIPQINNRLFWCIKACHLNEPLLIRILDGLCCTLSTKRIGTKNTREIAYALEYCCRLLCCYCRSVIVIADSHQSYGTIGGLNSLPTTLFTLSISADARPDILNIDFSPPSNSFNQCNAPDPASLDIIGTNVGNRKGHRTMSVVTITNKSIHRNDFDPCIISPLERFD